jgi:hypothetical protein
MNRYIVFMSLVFLTIPCFGQENFVINELVKPKKFKYLKKSNIKGNRNILLDDSLYIVTKTCWGEFGGTIIFKSKKTGIEYFTGSTCPIVVNKLNNKYYVTNSLLHLAGSSSVIEISDPEKIGVDSIYLRGIKIVVDSVGVTTLSSFPYKGELYHIVADYEKTYLAKVENNKFVTIDTVSKVSLRTYNPRVLVTENGHFITFFNHRDAKGYIDIFENQITIVRRKWHKCYKILLAIITIPI